jgi:endonuclease/exonuclease/phosphatase (EEP) superfamily protein YafD
LGIANTHLKWDNPQTHYGYRQMQQLLVECEALNVQSWIICGDLNVMPSSKVVALLQQAGFNFTHQNAIKAHTCNSNNRAKTLDYLFYNAGLSAEPLPLFPIEDDTPLPGPNQPSDHLPVVAQFRWLT